MRPFTYEWSQARKISHEAEDRRVIPIQLSNARRECGSRHHRLVQRDSEVQWDALLIERRVSGASTVEMTWLERRRRCKRGYDRSRERGRVQLREML